MKKILKLFVILIVIFILIGFAFTIRTITKVYRIDENKINDDINIIHISDFHSLKKYQEVIYQTINANPDLITLTGDIYTNSDNYEETVNFIHELVGIANVYYVNGNNDVTTNKYNNFINEISKLGVVVLQDEKIDITINSQQIRIIGLSDNPFSTIFNDNRSNAKAISKVLEKNISEKHYNIVLSHRPQYFTQFVESGADIVLTGHTHGGMVLIPFINQGLIAPDQGIFPEYDYGKFSKKNTTMIINSGCKTEYYIPRLYNPKEVVKIELR
ncbi:MAG: metallophosphoesterase [Bacilli bacterium]